VAVVQTQVSSRCKTTEQQNGSRTAEIHMQRTQAGRIQNENETAGKTRQKIQNGNGRVQWQKP